MACQSSERLIYPQRRHRPCVQRSPASQCPAIPQSPSTAALSGVWRLARPNSSCATCRAPSCGCLQGHPPLVFAALGRGKLRYSKGRPPPDFLSNERPQKIGLKFLAPSGFGNTRSVPSGYTAVLVAGSAPAEPAILARLVTYNYTIRCSIGGRRYRTLGALFTYN